MVAYLVALVSFSYNSSSTYLIWFYQINSHNSPLLFCSLKHDNLTSMCTNQELFIKKANYMTMGESLSSDSNASEQAGYSEVKSKRSHKKGAAKSKSTSTKLPSLPPPLWSTGMETYSHLTTKINKRVETQRQGLMMTRKVTKTRGSNETGMFDQPFGNDSTLSSVLQDQVTF